MVRPDGGNHSQSNGQRGASPGYCPPVGVCSRMISWRSPVQGFYNKDDYFDFMKRHMDLFVQADGDIRGYRIEEYNLDQINQGKICLR